MKFAIENDSVRQHGVNLTTTVEGLDQALQEFIGAVEALPGVWEGAAAQAFQELQQRYQEAARQLAEAMQSIQEKVDNAGQEYDRGDQEQTQTVESIANTLAQAFNSAVNSVGADASQVATKT